MAPHLSLNMKFHAPYQLERRLYTIAILLASIVGSGKLSGFPFLGEGVRKPLKGVFFRAKFSRAVLPINTDRGFTFKYLLSWRNIFGVCMRLGYRRGFRFAPQLL